MNKKLIIFLLIVIGFVAFLVYIDQRRSNPWDSDVFFSSVQHHLYG